MTTQTNTENKVKYFLIRESHISENYSQCNRDDIFSLKRSDNDHIPKVGEKDFIKCDYIGTDSCCDCRGYEIKIEEIQEYDDKFRQMLNIAITEKLNKGLNNNLKQINLESILGKESLKGLKRIFELESQTSNEELIKSNQN